MNENKIYTRRKIMFYGIFSIICLLGGSILLGQGVYKDDIRIVSPSIILLLIGFFNGYIWFLETIMTI